jgi:hypothetical protein
MEEMDQITLYNGFGHRFGHTHGEWFREIVRPANELWQKYGMQKVDIIRQLHAQGDEIDWDDCTEWAEQKESAEADGLPAEAAVVLSNEKVIA